MPTLNTNFSCDVILNGNDAAPAGPFATIVAAVAYLTNNFPLASGNHGIINIGPGIFTQSISVTATDKTCFIDYVGAGIDDTVLQGTSSAFIEINNSTAENRFSNMTISYTGASVLGNTAIDVSAATDVWFTNCKITSTQRCINNLQGGTVSNCSLSSTASNAEILVNSVGSAGYVGRLQNCDISASALASGGSAIGSVTASVVEYCDVNLNGNVATHGILDSFGGTVSNSNFVIGGYLLNNSAVFSNLFVNSSCISTVALELYNGSVEHCYFENTGTGQSTITSSGATGTIISSTFLQLNNSLTIYNPTASGTQVFDTVMLNNGVGGYCVSAFAVGDTLTVGNIISNCPIDPGFTLIDNGLTGTSIAQAKGYSQKRWWAINCNGVLANGVGCTVNFGSSGTQSNGNDTTNGPGVIVITAATTNGTAQVQTSTLDVVRGGNTPTLYVKFTLNQTTNTTFWCGLFNNALPGNVTTLGNDGAALRYAAGTDTDWQYVTNASGTQTTTSSGYVADTNVHTLKITLDLANSRVIFQLDKNKVVELTTNLPSSSSDLGFAIQVATQTSSSVAVTVNDAWCEYNS